LNRNLEILSSGFERIPQITKKLTEAEMADVEKLIEKMEEDDDVMNVYHTMEEVSFFLYLLNSVMLEFFFYNGYL
jgi:transcriptional/translational regulatory protein YebC/TACO1